MPNTPDSIYRKAQSIIKQAKESSVTELDLSNLTFQDYMHGEGGTNSKYLGVLPPEIGELHNLRSLNLSNNNLELLPPEIGLLSNLDALNISNNRLKDLPIEIGDLKNLKSLDLGFNRLFLLPKTIVQLSKLNSLDLTGNQLINLPLEIGKMQALTVLLIGPRAGKNGIILPPTNSIASLPDSIRKLKKLATIDLRGNPLPIPIEILEKINQPEIIFEYYFSHIDGDTRPLNEVKVIFIGQGSVGKTSLIKRLVKDEYNPQENKTEGISIRKWNTNVNNQSINLNLWDFGGQEIMHATHQFFLTKRSLYILVLDSRISQEDNRAEHWLKIIQAFGSGSPIIVVGNKIDQHQLDIDKKSLQRKYPNIKAFVETSCVANRGITELRNTISKEISALPHIHDKLLLSWFSIKNKLASLSDNIIPYPEFEAMCKKEGINEEISRQTLIGFLHDLGAILYFQDDPQLQALGVLKPEWVTNGVYQILNSRIIYENSGVFNLSDLATILNPNEYKAQNHAFIVEMMEKFELCYKIDSSTRGKYLIPDLLSKSEPDTGSWNDGLSFQYDYLILPSSIISRFIVRMHSNISRDTIWRSGAVLNIDGNKVLVRADYDDRRITILVKGERKREALTTVRTIINSINRSVPGLVSVERVAIPKYPEADPMKYEDLLKLEQEDRISVPVVIDGQVVDIDVTEILNGIEAGEIRNVAGLSNQGVPFLQNAASDINLSQAEAIAPSNNTERSPGANQPGIARVIFSSIPKIFGEFVFDVFGRHNAALSSKLILGYILIFCGLLIIIGIINITDLVELFKYNWRFFNPEPSIIVP